MLKKAEDHVASLLLKMEEANANLQQPEQKDLLDCEADCEEIWRGEIQSDLVSTYFESCLKSLVDQVNVLITGLVDSGNKLPTCQQELSTFVDQSTKGIDSIQGKISELQTRFKCQEAHLQDLLEQEHRKISEMLTKQEELHALKDALRE